jgi:hypothetical protein
VTLGIITLDAEHCYAKCHFCWLSLMLSVKNKPYVLSVIMINVVVLLIERERERERERDKKSLLTLELECFYLETHYSLVMLEAGIPYWRGRLSTVDLLELTGSDQLLLIVQTLFFCKTSYVNEEANCSGPSPSVSVPCWKFYAANKFQRKTF